MSSSTQLSDDDKNLLAAVEGITEEELEAGREKDTEDHRAYSCTVVSLLPYTLHEEKPHMLPSTFIVPAASMDGKRLGILWVREGIHYIPNPLMDEGKPGASIKQVTTPSEMARSICEDYNCAHVALGEDASPGLFWVPGRVIQKDVEKNHSKRLNVMKLMQRNWFHNLCVMADADWEKNHDMRAVSDLQRLAARSLGIQRQWVEFRLEEMTRCPYCNSSVSPTAAVCANCKEVIDRSKYAKLKSEFDVNKFLLEMKEAKEAKGVENG